MVERLINPDPEKRLQNATELIEELAEMAPSPKVHKRLGTLVEDRMDAERTTGREVSSTIGKAPEDEAEVAAAEERQPVPATTSEPKTSRRRRAWMLVLVALLVMGAGVFAMMRAPEVGIEPVADTDAVTGTVDVTDTDTRNDSVADTDADAYADSDADADEKPVAARPASPRKPVRPKPAHLDVVIIPWGDVWINGKRWGSAPMMGERLKPGRYRISVGQGEPAKSRTVRLRSGDRKTLNFDFTE